MKSSIAVLLAIFSIQAASARTCVTAENRKEKESVQVCAEVTKISNTGNTSVTGFPKNAGQHFELTALTQQDNAHILNHEFRVKDLCTLFGAAIVPGYDTYIKDASTETLKVLVPNSFPQDHANSQFSDVEKLILRISGKYRAYNVEHVVTKMNCYGYKADQIQRRPGPMGFPDRMIF